MLEEILNSLKNADLSLVLQNTEYLNNEAMYLLNTEPLSNEEVNKLQILLSICNILYNDTDIEVLPIDDGLYDILLEKYRSYNSNIPIGAEPIQFAPINNNVTKRPPRQVVFFYDTEKINESVFMKDMFYTDFNLREVEVKNPIKIAQSIGKRLHNTAHEHPDLVGTLDKCKFVLMSKAISKGVENDNKVKVLERDFFHAHISAGIINPNRIYTMVLELKYDGVSVEADCSNVVISARSRGDTGIGVASDITPILNGYPFPNSPLITDTIGVKFEAIMTQPDLQRFNITKGKSYKNCRTAIIGLFGSSDAWKYRDFITLIPLAIDQKEANLKLNRIEEIEFINKVFRSKNQPLRYQVISGTYVDLLIQIQIFLDEMEYLRQYIPFMYDGIVVSYVDEDVRQALGRSNYINKYSMAVKFNPLKCLTAFRGYQFTVGQDGSITPMIYYDPVEFYGTMHLKSTGHSYSRFMELGLRYGDILEIEYTNDVMPYVNKAENQVNNNNPNPIIPFIDKCPCCNSPIVIAKSKKTAYCTNINCQGRIISRVVNMIKKLNILNCGESTMNIISVYSFGQLLELSENELRDKGLGPVEAASLIKQITKLKTEPLYDFVVIGSLGFTDIGLRKWKLILYHYTLAEIYYLWKDNNLNSELIHIKGIGPSTACTIVTEMEMFEQDILYILNMQNIIVSKGNNYGKVIRFSGVRDAELEEFLISLGHDCDGNASLTSNTDILIVPYDGYESSKTSKASSNGILIISLSDFKTDIKKYLN